ncbi:RNase H domain-containing protein [Caerostris extrusa]|uniref:RNase H domain-containing protein n=1 Tax=Caerostris extrusa TaxID=172846 RepID=A0AAV4X6Y8_CAEEX|nr:RNase H domain-containing protein [Caerostris extrusa]
MLLRLSLKYNFLAPPDFPLCINPFFVLLQMILNTAKSGLRASEVGESICHSLLDYYCAIKYIPPEDVPKAVRESCCKGSRAKMISNGNIRSPHRVVSGPTATEKKTASQTVTSKTKPTKTKAVASKLFNEQKHSANQKSAHTKTP